MAPVTIFIEEVSFLWSVDNFNQQLATMVRTVPLTSHLFSSDGNRWRAVLKPDGDLFLQLVSAAHPVTVEVRYVRCKSCWNSHL